jgi:uncharacterized protein YvpB
MYTRVLVLLMILLESCACAPVQPVSPAAQVFTAAPATHTVTTGPPPLALVAATPTSPAPVSTPTPRASQPASFAVAAPTQEMPAEHYIRQIRGHHQYFPLGCETAAAKDWANYFDKDFNEFEFQYRLPLSDNPDLGFVGDVNSPWGQVPPYGYGVYAGPIADLLNQYGVPARAYKGYTLEQIKAKLSADKPVIVWVIGNMVGGVSAKYTDSRGNQTIVAAYEHVVILTGYNESQIRYLNNGRFYQTPVAVFLNSWGILGNMVVVDQ